MARKRKQLPETPEPASIESLSHDGRGIARRDGKTTFIDNALPGEEVMFKFTYMRRKFDEGKAVEIVRASRTGWNLPASTAPCAVVAACST